MPQFDKNQIPRPSLFMSHRIKIGTPYHFFSYHKRTDEFDVTPGPHPPGEVDRRNKTAASTVSVMTKLRMRNIAAGKHPVNPRRCRFSFICRRFSGVQNGMVPLNLKRAQDFLNPFFVSFPSP